VKEKKKDEDKEEEGGRQCVFLLLELEAVARK
jgi:hypothetical protein